MAATKYDVLGIGNAIVDVLSHADEDFLTRQKMPKGSMSLIDERRADAIYNAMGPVVECSGGSAANTIVGVAMLGGSAAFIGKVKDDELGQTFARDIRASGVAFSTPMATQGPATARSFILVTPDGQRTMNTYLGAAQDLTPDDIAVDEVRSASVLYLEGYLWDPKQAKAAFVKAAEIAHDNDRTVALTLSDAFCVDRYRKEFLGLLRNNTVDLLFANEAELKSLYETGDFDAAVTALRKDVTTAVVTRSEKGAMVVTREETETVPAFPIDRVVDTTGAGDLFAAGFLYGFSQRMPHVASLRLGALCAAEIISHIGARPERKLVDLANEHGLLR
ncbi:MAG: adenosine kinase [Xanthobacteraceae bacterium]|nr:adenosine kinase [Xanthobacteraceae bacterium]QYK45121.1 MAG: adenosine kinase [Xanthobacteraceae bacterium]